MEAQTYLQRAALLLAIMALVAVVETALPFRRGSPWRSRHAIPNVALTVLLLTLNFALNAAFIGTTAYLHASGVGLMTGSPIPAAIQLAIGVVALDFATWIVHWLMHRSSLLWRFHRVHHSDPLVDVTTAYRQHPVEGVLRFAFTLAPAWLLGVSPEAVAVYRLLSALNALLEHMNIKIWQPLDALLSWVIVTPNMHKVHHSRVQSETDSNYGNLLAAYDRLFGTFTPSRRAASVVYGLDGYDAPELQRFAGLMILPWSPSQGARTESNEPNSS